MYFDIHEVTFGDEKSIQKICETLAFIKKDYPDFISWYTTKVRSGLKDGSRRVFVATTCDQHCIAGVLILKNDGKERKISTLCVIDDYRFNGLGTEFIKLAINVLGDKKPIITVSDLHMNEFKPLLKKFGFDYFAEYHGYYRTGISEHAYNGYLNSERLEDGCSVAV